MTDSIDNSRDFIDSRDVIARIEELERDREALSEAVDEAQRELDARRERLETEGRPIDVEEEKRVLEDAKSELEDWDADDDAEELKKLKALAEECENECEWQTGATLIRDSYFTEYAEQLASDTCDMGKATDWPFRHIDWEVAAKELRQDYSTVDFDGEDYLIRN